jgi:hypothetical protein
MKVKCPNLAVVFEEGMFGFHFIYLVNGQISIEKALLKWWRIIVV